MIVQSASVKVMRSFDYCHFEVVLGYTAPATLNEVDALRKEAARLADKAVKQYQIAKRNAEIILSEEISRQNLVSRMERVEMMAEGDRTVSQQAELKAYRDESWAKSKPYDYEDEWVEDYQDLDD